MDRHNEIADPKPQAQWLYTAFARVSAGFRQNLPAACFQSAKLLLKHEVSQSGGSDVKLRPKIAIFPDRRQLATALSAHVAYVAGASSRARGRFCVAFSGGSLMEIIAPALSASPLRDRIDWSAWHVFWADERWVPPSSPDSNFGVALRLLFSRVTIPGEHIHAVDDSQNPDDTARAYEAVIRKTLHAETDAFPRFDLVLLGLGEDGHTASLFPGHPALKEGQRWVVPVFNAPKPPPVRMTLTLPVINHARCVVFVAAGAGKANMISKALDPKAAPSKLPARMVKPADGELHWFIDQAAASGLQTLRSMTKER
jgi:6-phosphogluconolactonase